MAQIGVPTIYEPIFRVTSSQQVAEMLYRVFRFFRGSRT
jgi:hypothetical protein